MPSERELEDTYGEYAMRLKALRDEKGLSAAVYTQITDVEIESNGLLTYDRVLKVDPAKIALANRFAYPPADPRGPPAHLGEGGADVALHHRRAADGLDGEGVRRVRLVAGAGRLRGLRRARETRSERPGTPRTSGSAARSPCPT